MSLEHLPYEVIDIIARYLDVIDISACCATCSLWRDVFNGDSIWKRNCNLELTEYLNSTECRVKPSSEWLEVVDNESSSLSPLSTWRKNYMMEVRLFRNWREGRYEQQELGTKIGGNNENYDLIVDFLQNDYIIYLHTKELNNEIVYVGQIWNVKGSPFLHSTFTMNFNEVFTKIDISVHNFNIIDNKLIVSYKNVVMIYEILLSSSNPISLTHVFFVDLSEDESKSLIHQAKADAGVSLSFTSYASIGFCNNFLIGIIDYESMHIWDVLSGKKITEVLYPENKEVDTLLTACKDEKNNTIIIEVLLLRDEYSSHYLGYDLSKMEFGNFNFKNRSLEFDFHILHGKFVIGADSNGLFSYNYNTSDYLADRKFKSSIIKGELAIVGNYLFYHGFDSSTMHVMNPSSLDIIHSINFGLNIPDFDPICSRFVIMNNTHPELWEIGKTCKLLFQFSGREDIYIRNQQCTKIVQLSTKATVLNFW